MSKLGYRNFTVLWVSALFIAFICWILFGPEGGGRYALKEDGELTFRGIVALACGLPLVLILLPHLFHVLLRRPALEVGDGQLRIWMLPYETIPLADISKIQVGDNSIDIFRHGKRRRRINARILDEPRTFFFDEVESRIGSRAVVEEK